MARAAHPGLRRSRQWLAMTGIAAVAASGCAQAMPLIAPAPDSALNGVVKPGAQFDTVMRNGHLYCTSCNTELTAQGRHKVANLLTSNLRALRTGQVLKMAAAKPGERNLRQTILVSLLRLKMYNLLGIDTGSLVPKMPGISAAVRAQAILGNSDPTKIQILRNALDPFKLLASDPDAAVRLLPDYAATYADAIAYVSRYSSACCVPDGAATPDGPY
jgi:hypothetical protein